MTGTTLPRKVIIVTGASSGFGRLAVEELGKAGHMVLGPARVIHPGGYAIASSAG